LTVFVLLLCTYSLLPFGECHKNKQSVNLNASLIRSEAALERACCPIGFHRLRHLGHRCVLDVSRFAGNWVSLSSQRDALILKKVSQHLHLFEISSVDDAFAFANISKCIDSANILLPRLLSAQTLRSIVILV
jgi:hypothetical protein